MPNKFLLIIRLIRLTSPTGYLLLFFPCCFGLSLANSLSIKSLLIFFAGSVITRSAGCIINDMLDKDFDKHVARTKERPLASRALTSKEAITTLIFLSLLSLLLLLLLTPFAICLGIFAVILIVLYPLAKRVTHFPQIFLGFTFNIGALISYASAVNFLAIETVVMYLACCFWTIGYDTIYGFADIKDDKKIGVKSMSIFLENKKYKLWLYGCYLIYIILFIAAAIIADIKVNFILIAAAGLILSWQVRTLQINDPQNCLVRFKSNNYVGISLILSLMS